MVPVTGIKDTPRKVPKRRYRIRQNCRCFRVAVSVLRPPSFKPSNHNILYFPFDTRLRVGLYSGTAWEDLVGNGRTKKQADVLLIRCVAHLVLMTIDASNSATLLDRSESRPNRLDRRLGEGNLATGGGARQSQRATGARTRIAFRGRGSGWSRGPSLLPIQKRLKV
jgi:hypothetical protein